MNENVELLNYIHQNAKMGISTINKLLDIVEEDEFKKYLESQYNEYKEIFDESDRKLHDIGKEAKGIGDFQKVSTNFMINLNTLTNKSASHISEMMIQGSTMGTIDATKKLNRYKNADNDIRKLASDLLKFEEKNIEELKKFL